MELILFQPPRIGLKVYYHAQEGGAPYPGVYTVVDTEDYNMVGYVTVEDSNGRGYGVNAKQLEILEYHDDFNALALGVAADSIVFLPSEEKLREFGFTDRREGYWYYSAPVGSNETFNLTIPKEPIGEVLGEPVYSYTESVIDEFFGQHAYFGGMRDDFRYPLAEKISEALRGLLKIGIRVRVHPDEYNWKEWPHGRALWGMSSDQQTMEQLKAGFVYAGTEKAIAEAVDADQEPVAAVPTVSEPSIESTLDPEILKQVAAAIDREAENFEYDSLAHGMTMEVCGSPRDPALPPGSSPQG